jgi:predicted small metal-binding protein
MEFPAFLITITRRRACQHQGENRQRIFLTNPAAPHIINYRANFQEVDDMGKQMYQITCSPDCGFMLRSHDKDEVRRLAKEHVKKMHNMDVSDADLEKDIKQTNG